MTRKSLNFISGYVVFGIEEKVNDYLKDNAGQIMTVGCEVSKNIFTDSTEYIKYVPKYKIKKVCSMCCSALEEAFPKYRVKGNGESTEDNIVFTFSFERKDMPKCMTKEEIEKELGYKITIIDRR